MKEALKRIASELRYYSPLADKYKGEFIHKVWANEIDELLAQPAVAEQHKQEPVALEAVYETIIHWDEGGGKRSRRELARRIVSLYTTPPQTKEPEQESVAMADYMAVVEKYVFLKASQRKPLSKTEIASLVTKNGGDDWWWKDIEQFARAIEAAHGIKGEA